MKEYYIKNKIVSLFGRKESQKSIDTMERNRRIACIGNQWTVEYDRKSEELKRHMCSFLHRLLNEELK